MVSPPTGCCSTPRPAWILARVARVALALVAGAGTAPLRAQPPALRPVAPLTEAERAKHEIELRRDAAGRIEMVVWGENQIPLERKVADCDVGLVPGGDALVVLAGGVRGALDLYLVARGGSFQRHATNGRLLSRKFNDGHGSWPLVEGPHLVLFGYEKGTRIEFRALDFSGRVLLERRLPATVEGWQATSNPDGFVEVTFGAAAELVTFRHPLAPRLELSGGGLVQFGKVPVGGRARRMVELTNRGERPLDLTVAPVQDGFELLGTPPKTLAPGATHHLKIEFAPVRAGAVESRMELRATGVVPVHVVVLRGAGAAAATAVPPGAPGTAGAAGATPQPGQKHETPPAGTGATAADPGPPAPPRVSRFVCHPRGRDHALVQGRLLAPVPPAVVLEGRAERVRVPVSAAGGFHATMQVAGGEAIRICAAANELESPFVDFGTVPEMLSIEAGHATVRCLPGERFVLTARVGDDVIRRWRGTADATGQRRLPLSILGQPPRGAPRIEITLEVAVVTGGESGRSQRSRRSRRVVAN